MPAFDLGVVEGEECETSGSRDEMLSLQEPFCLLQTVSGQDDNLSFIYDLQPSRALAKAESITPDLKKQGSESKCSFKATQRLESWKADFQSNSLYFASGT